MKNLFDKNTFWEQAIPADPDFLQNVQSCLIMAPHPDDESLGCAGLIATLQTQGTAVNVILTTDGSRSHPNSLKFPASVLATLRLSEMNQAMELLGLETQHLRYYEAQDASMPAKGMPGFDELLLRLTADLKDLQPDLILVPYELDPHCDHRATWQLLIAALEKAKIRRPRIWEYPIWLYEHAAAEDIPELETGELLVLDIGEYASLKEECIHAHQSQTTRLIDDDPKGFILLPQVISNFTKGREYFMERKRINPSDTLHQQYFENMYLNNKDPWSFETSRYEQEKYTATIGAIPAGQYARALELGCSIGVLTAMLAERCEHLLSMDISETALAQARQRLSASSNVEFLHGGIPGDFPAGSFDLIIMSEVGYYLSSGDLKRTRDLILQALAPQGLLILVHWTHFVADYPLTGDEVHEMFSTIGLNNIHANRTADYRIDVYQNS